MANDEVRGIGEGGCLLTEEEYREFRHWFLERDWEQWDRQMEADSRTGKLDFIVREALEAKKQGKLDEL